MLKHNKKTTRSITTGFIMVVITITMLFFGCSTPLQPIDQGVIPANDVDARTIGPHDFPLEPEFFSGGDGIGGLSGP